MSSTELAKLIALSIEKQTLSAKSLHRLLRCAGELNRGDAPKLFRHSTPETSRRVLERVNDIRRKLGGSPLTWKTPRKVFQDWARIAEGDAKHLAIAISKKSPAFRYGQWKKFVFSPEFLRDSGLNCFFDECADLILGLDERRMQRELRGKKMPRSYRRELSYLTLTPEELFTPYRVLISAIKKAPDRPFTFVDLGCGWGRAGLVLLASHPHAKFIGYELVEARAKKALAAASKLPLARRFSIEVADLSEMDSIEGADYYFLFNPFNRKTLRRVFRLIQPHRSRRPVVISVLFGAPFHTLKRADWAKRGAALDFPDWPGKGIQYFQAR